MRFGLRLAFRYLTAGRSQSILMVSLVMIGVTAYTFITATVQGVQSNVINNSLGSSSHITIEAFDRYPFNLSSNENRQVITVKGKQREKELMNWRITLQSLKGVPGVIAVSPVVSGSGFAIRGTQSRPINIKGGETEATEGIVKLKDDLIAGKFSLESGKAVIGVTLGKKLNIGLNDSFTIQSNKGVSKTFRVIGIVDAGNPNFDESTVFVELGEAQRLLDKVGALTVIESKVEDIFAAPKIGAGIHDRTALNAKTWMSENTQVLTLITSQNIATGVIRGFALLSVAFGVASVLSVTVSQKSKEIGILKSMGAKDGSITAVFVILGGLIGIVGGSLGAILSYGTTLLVKSATGTPVKGQPSFSMDFRPEYIWQAVAVALVVAVLGALSPARKAARMDPVEAIRV